MQNKIIKNIILHFTSYAKLVFSAKDFIDFRIYDIKKSIYLNSTTNEMQEELYTTCAIFTLKKDCNKEIVIEHDGMGTLKAKIFDYIGNGCQIKAIEFIYEDGTNEYIKVALFDDNPEPENNFHCESKILENGDLHVILDKKVNENLSGIRCK